MTTKRVKDWLIRGLGGFTSEDIAISVEENCRLRGDVVWRSVDDYGMPKTSHNQIALWNGRWPRFGKCLAAVPGVRDYGDGKSFYDAFDTPLKGITHYAIMPMVRNVEEG